MPAKKIEARYEQDQFGQIQLPANAYWGAATARALELQINLPALNPRLLEAALYFEKAAALTSTEYGLIDPAFGRAVGQAVDETLSGQWKEQFQVGLLQADAQAAFFANIHEFLRNRAGEMLGNWPDQTNAAETKSRLDCGRNIEQDFAAVLKLAVILLQSDLKGVLVDLERLLRKKALEFECSARSYNKDQEVPAENTNLPAVFNGFGFEIGRVNKVLAEAACRFNCFGPVYTSKGSHEAERNRVMLLKLGNYSGTQIEYTAESLASIRLNNDLAYYLSCLRLLAISLKQIAAELQARNASREILLPPVYATANSQTTLESQEIALDTNCKSRLAVLDFIEMVSAQALGLDAASNLALLQQNSAGSAALPLLAQNLLSSIEMLRQSVIIFNKRCLQNLCTISGGSSKTQVPASVAVRFTQLEA